MYRLTSFSYLLTQMPGSCQVGRVVFLLVITPPTAPLILVDNSSSRRTASPQEASDFLLQQIRCVGLSILLLL